MSIDDTICLNAHFYNRDTIQDLANATYIALRPTYETGQYATICFLDEAEDFKIDYGRSNGPPYLMAEYGTAEDAIKALIAIKAAYPHLCTWYNGQEVQDEIIGDVWTSLAEILSGACYEWELVSEVAAGTLASDDPDVLKRISYDQTIAAAIAHITA